MCFLGKAATGEPLVPLVRGNLTAITPEFPVLGYCHFEIHSAGWGKYVEKWNFLWRLADFWVWKHCIEVSWTIYRLKGCRSWVKHLMEIPKLAIFDSFVHKLSWNSSGIFSMSWAVVPVPVGLVWNLAALFPPIRWKDGKCRISAWAALHWLSKCVPYYCYLMFAHSRARRNWMRIQIKETELTHIFPGIG